MERPLLPPDVLGLRRTPSGPSRSTCRALAAVALGALQREDARKICKSSWPGDASAEQITRAVINPTSTSTSGVADLLASGFGVLSVAPQSAASKLFSRCLQLDFRGVHRFAIPTVSSVPEAAWVAEGSGHIVDEGEVTTTIAGPVRKLSVSVTLTNELNSATPDTAAAIISRALSGKYASTLDGFVFDSVDADSVRPAGLLHSVSDLGAESGGGIAALTADVATIVGAAESAGGDIETLMFFSDPKTAAKFKLLAGPRFDFPIIGSSGITDGSLIGILPGAIYFGGDGQATVETSRAATVVQEDSNVEPLSASGTVAQSVRSLWQTDSFNLRIRQKLTWGPIVSGAVSLVSSISW